MRYVNAILEKKPTVSLPSALEVLKTRIGDCNEHTALYVAMARSLGLPARIAVGLVYLRGAFYYHAWPEVWVEESRGRGLWLPVDPTLNQFPADATHVRLARGGLERQAAILGLVGRARLEITRRRAAAGGDPHPRRPCPDRPAAAGPAAAATGRQRAGLLVFSRAEPRMILVENLVKTFGSFRAVDGVSLEVAPGEIHGFLGPNGAGKTTTIRMIAGLLKPTAGRVTIDGHDLAREPEAAKGALGFIPDRPFLYEKLTAARVPALPRRPLRDGGRGNRGPRGASCSRSSSSSPGRTSSSRASPTA